MDNISSYIMAAIEWGIVPLILSGILIFVLFCIPSGNVHPRVKSSVSAGKWSGLIILVLFIISQKDRELAFSFTIPVYDFAIWPTLISLFAGFLSSRLFDLIKHSRILGFFAIILVSGASITFYSYIFMPTVRSTIVFIALGLILGVLLHEVFFPEKDEKKYNGENQNHIEIKEESDEHQNTES